MAGFGTKNPYTSANSQPPKKRPSRIDYSIPTDAKPANPRGAKQTSRLDYSYKGGSEVRNSVTEVKLPLEAQQPHNKAFDQNTAPIPNKKKNTNGMHETIIPLGTINVPLTVVDGKKRTPQPAPQQVRRNPPPKQAAPAQVINKASAKKKPQTQQKPVKKQPPKPRDAAAEKRRPKPARQAPPPPKAPAKPLSYGEARRRRAKRNIIAAIAAAVIIITGIVVSVTVVFKIDTITVNGESPYTSEQITAAFGYNYGDNLFKFSIDSASAAIETSLPYLETVTIRRHLPGTVQIDVTQSVETYSMNTDSGWAVLSPTFKVLRLSAEPATGLTYLSGVTAETPTAGKPITLTDADTMSALETITSTLAKYSFAPVNEIDLTNLLEITFLYDNRIRVLIGTINDVDNKIDYAHNLVTPELLTDSLSANERGSLDVSGRNSEGRMVAVWLAGEP